MKNIISKCLTKSIPFFVIFIPLLPFENNSLNAEYLNKELEIDSSTKREEGGSIIPTNPFEIVEMIRRNYSMNDATKPSDAIDDALKSFNNLEEK